MRQITSDAVDAFLSGKEFRRGNTEVIVDEAGCSRMLLFGNQIAFKREDRIDITNAGYTTQTTKDRLNGILSKLRLGFLYQEARAWYWFREWDAPSKVTEFPSNEWVQIQPGNVLHELSAAAGE